MLRMYRMLSLPKWPERSLIDRSCCSAPRFVGTGCVKLLDLVKFSVCVFLPLPSPSQRIEPHPVVGTLFFVYVRGNIDPALEAPPLSRVLFANK